MDSYTYKVKEALKIYSELDKVVFTLKDIIQTLLANGFKQDTSFLTYLHTVKGEDGLCFDTYIYFLTNPPTRIDTSTVATPNKLSTVKIVEIWGKRNDVEIYHTKIFIKNAEQLLEDLEDALSTIPNKIVDP